MIRNSKKNNFHDQNSQECASGTIHKLYFLLSPNIRAENKMVNNLKTKENRPKTYVKLKENQAKNIRFSFSKRLVVGAISNSDRQSAEVKVTPSATFPFSTHPPFISPPINLQYFTYK